MYAHDLVAHVEAIHIRSDLFHCSGKFMSEESRHRHLGMPAPEGLQVRAAGKGRLNLKYDLTWSRLRPFDFLHFQMTGTYQYSGKHTLLLSLFSLISSYLDSL